MAQRPEGLKPTKTLESAQKQFLYLTNYSIKALLDGVDALVIDDALQVFKIDVTEYQHHHISHVASIH